MGGSASPSNDKIKMRAFAIWEEEGRPDGKHLEHWERAGVKSPMAPTAPSLRKARRRRRLRGAGRRKARALNNGVVIPLGPAARR